MCHAGGFWLVLGGSGGGEEGGGIESIVGVEDKLVERLVVHELLLGGSGAQAQSAVLFQHPLVAILHLRHDAQIVGVLGGKNLVLALEDIALLLDGFQLLLLDFPRFLSGGPVTKHTLDAPLFLLFGGLCSLSTRSKVLVVGSVRHMGGVRGGHTEEADS